MLVNRLLLTSFGGAATGTATEIEHVLEEVTEGIEPLWLVLLGLLLTSLGDGPLHHEPLLLLEFLHLVAQLSFLSPFDAVFVRISLPLPLGLERLSPELLGTPNDFILQDASERSRLLGDPRVHRPVVQISDVLETY